MGGIGYRWDETGRTRSRQDSRSRRPPSRKHRRAPQDLDGVGRWSERWLEVAFAGRRQRRRRATARRREIRRDDRGGERLGSAVRFSFAGSDAPLLEDALDRTRDDERRQRRVVDPQAAVALAVGEQLSQACTARLQLGARIAAQLGREAGLQLGAEQAHHRARLRAALVEAQQPDQVGLELRRRGAGLARGLEFATLGALCGEHFQEQSLLAAEVQVDAAFGHAHTPSDAVEAGRHEAALRELAAGDAEDSATQEGIFGASHGWLDLSTIPRLGCG